MRCATDHIQHGCTGCGLPKKEKKMTVHALVISLFCMVSILLSASDDMSKSRVLRVDYFLEGHSKLKWGVMGEILAKAKVWGTSGHSWFYEIPLNASYIPLRPTVAPLLQHTVFTAATHYQRMNITSVWMPLHELIEQKVTSKTGLWSKLWNGAP